MWVSLYVPSCFSLAAFKIFLLVFSDSYNVSQYESVFVFILFENLSFLDLDMFLSQVREVSAIMSLN